MKKKQRPKISCQRPFNLCTDYLVTCLTLLFNTKEFCKAQYGNKMRLPNYFKFNGVMDGQIGLLTFIHHSALI
jgi:hypothetical protein